MKHLVPDRVKPSFVIFDLRALGSSALSVTLMATVDVKGLAASPGWPHVA